jgi:hypothetical protein
MLVPAVAAKDSRGTAMAQPFTHALSLDKVERAPFTTAAARAVGSSQYHKARQRVVSVCGAVSCSGRVNALRSISAMVHPPVDVGGSRRTPSATVALALDGMTTAWHSARASTSMSAKGNEESRGAR